jgi:hypothetical protein
MRLHKVHFENEDSLRRLGLGLALSVALFSLTACGGGGSSVPAPVAALPAPDAPLPITISGVVAKGIALAGASVVATSPAGTLGAPVTVAADGRYSLTVPADVQVPIVLTASLSLPTGGVERYTSVIADRSNNYANITPITNVIAALLSTNGNPDGLASQVSGGAPITQAALSAKVLTVQNVLKTAVDALGVGSVDPINGSFAVNGSGYSRLLDSINASITSLGAFSNIEIGLKVKGATDSAQPPVAQFTSHQLTALPSLPAVAASAFVPDGTVSKLAQLMADLEACYALPLASRISKASANATEVVGSATDISAAVCKGLFYGNSPGSYKNGGNLVGRNSLGIGAFSGIFDGFTIGAKFNTASLDFVLTNGDIGFSFLSALAGGTPSLSGNIARLDPADQKLKFIGDQYTFNGRVQAFMQKREFPVANQAQWSYLSTGYTLNVDNTLQFDRVEVAGPTGIAYTLTPRLGVNALVFASKGPSNFLRLRSEFTETSKTGPVPSKLTSEASVVAFETPEYSELALTATPAQSVWTFRYFITGNTGATPDSVQVYRTRARALSIAELRARPLASVTPSVIANLSGQALPLTGSLPLSTSSSFNLSWALPVGALPPVNSTLFGFYLTGVGATSIAAFADSANFQAGVGTSASIACVKQNDGDVHCSGATNGGFKAGSEANGLNLASVDSFGRNFSAYYAFSLLTIAP